MLVTKRDGRKEILDITKIQKMTSDATAGLDGVSQSDLELDAKIKFIDGMHSSDIQDALIKTSVEKIDVDAPNWTFVGARLLLYDLYHRVGRTLNSTKGINYPTLSKYINHNISVTQRLWSGIAEGYDLDDLNAYMDPNRDLLFSYLGIKTFYDKYILKDQKGEPVELPQLMFMAISMFLAQNEPDKQEKAKSFYDVISKFEVMLATPTLSNARKKRPQLSSCFINSVPDNIEGIFDIYKECALLSKFGGGIGTDWNQLRSLGGSIDNHENAAGGTIPFLKIDNDIAVAVDQLGTRKGAIAVYLEPWHLDILDFLDLKKNSGEERRRAHELFPALWISDLFMERIQEDSHWTLFDPYEVEDLSELYGDEFKEKYIAYENDDNITKQVINAKELWKKIITEYFETGSPFLCFKDTANRSNPNKHKGKIRSSNLCTEIFQNTSADKYLVKVYIEDGKNNSNYASYEETDTLVVKVSKDSAYSTKVAKDINSLDILIGKFIGVEEDGEMIIDCTQPSGNIYCVEKEKINGETAVCNLASINLSKINTKEDIERVVPIAIRMLDNVIDLNYYPIKKAKDTNLKTRAIGLGVMGEAQMLAESKIYFGTKEHLDKIDNIMEMVSYNAIKASSELGKEKGNYPMFKGSNWSEGKLPIDFVSQETIDLTFDNSRVYNADEWQALRDSASNNMRNGYLMAIAPTSSISILVGTTQAIEPIYKRKWFEENLSGLIPVTAPNLNPDTWSYYIPAFEIDQLQIIKAAAIRQKWIDQGQSTNIFMSLDKASGRYLHEIYTLAWKLGLKSTYYLRSQSPEAKSDIADRSMECSGCQ